MAWGSVGLDPLLSMFSGRTAMLKKELIVEKKEQHIRQLEKMFNHLDPGHIMNPGKLLPEDKNEFGRRNAECGKRGGG